VSLGATSEYHRSGYSRPPRSVRLSPDAEAFDEGGHRYCDQRPEGIETILPASPATRVRGRAGLEWRRGWQRDLPWGSVPFDGLSTGGRSVSACLTDTFRSQSFSLSQRFDPARTSWLCFAPHPSRGFRSSELFPLSQPIPLARFCALLPSGQRFLLGNPRGKAPVSSRSRTANPPVGCSPMTTAQSHGPALTSSIGPPVPKQGQPEW